MTTSIGTTSISKRHVRPPLVVVLLLQCIPLLNAFIITPSRTTIPITINPTTTTKRRRHPTTLSSTSTSSSQQKPRQIAIIGAGWGGLSAAYHLTRTTHPSSHNITLIDASPRVGGLVRDGFLTTSGKRRAEAGQHGFWDNYHNIFDLISKIEEDGEEDILTGYAPQGQYSPRGLEAIWPIYRDGVQLPTGLAQLAYTRFLHLPLIDRLSALPLVGAFSEFDDSASAWAAYDGLSFRDLCVKLGVSRRCYDEAFEPMILTGLFAPGRECSAAAALGMAYFFVMKSQNSFDVRWCKGNVGERIFDPWIASMTDRESANPVTLMTGTKAVGFDTTASPEPSIASLTCRNDDAGDDIILPVDDVIFAVGASALRAMVRNSPPLAALPNFSRFANLRGTSVLATRLYLDKFIDIPYTANAVWGFDVDVGQTFFDITTLHGSADPTAPGSVVEIDYYHANSLLVLSDDAIVAKAKSDLDVMLGAASATANVVDAAVVRLPDAVNWYFPGSYKSMPDAKADGVANVYFAGDLVRSRHGSWSQEKAYVTGMEVANMMLGRERMEGVRPVGGDEWHVVLGRRVVTEFKTLVGGGRGVVPSLVDFIW